MRNKFLVGLTTTAAAVSMLVAPSVTAFANEDIRTDISESDGKEHTYECDVKSEDGTSAVVADGEGTVISITGDISSSGTIEQPDQWGTSTAGEPTVDVSNGAKVKITGDITSTNAEATIDVSDSNSSIEVTGDVTTNGNYTRKYVSSGDERTLSGYGVQVVASGDTPSTGTSAKINGNIITYDGNTGATIRGKNASLNVTGDINASGSYTSYTNSEGIPSYQGATGLMVNSGTAEVEGNIIGARCGLEIFSGEVTVGGSITATGSDTSIGRPDEKGNIELVKNSSVGHGIVTFGEGNVTIKNDLNALDVGIQIQPDNDNVGEDKTIVIEGAIKLSSDDSKGIVAVNSGAELNKNGGNDYESVEDYMNDIPKIVVGEINATTPVKATGVITGMSLEESSKKITEALTNAINYIIKVDEASEKDYDIKVSGENVETIKDYKTVNINEAFEVAASLPEGARLDAGKYVSVNKNENGTYTLTLTDSRGGINIKAVIAPVDNGSGQTEYEVINVSTTPTPEPTSSSPSDAPAGAIVVAPVPPAAAGSASSPISGDKAATSVSMDLGKVTPIQYKNAVIQNVATAPSNGALNIETDRVSVLDSKMIQAIASRPDIDVNVVFTYLGRRIKVTIPAGYDVSKLLDDYGYCGYLRLLSILGGTDI